MINALITFFIVGLDQFSKFLAVTYLQGEPKSIIQGVFELNYVQNTGAAFGIMQNSSMLFLVITPLILTALFAYILIYKSKRTYTLPLILILGGALGNYIDRVRMGYVVDFLDFKVWPVFNLADTSIVIGALLFAIILITEESKEKIREDKNGSAS